MVIEIFFVQAVFSWLSYERYSLFNSCLAIFRKLGRVVLKHELLPRCVYDWGNLMRNNDTRIIKEVGSQNIQAHLYPTKKVFCCNHKVKQKTRKSRYLLNLRHENMNYSFAVDTQNKYPGYKKKHQNCRKVIEDLPPGNRT